MNEIKHIDLPHKAGNQKEISEKLQDAINIIIKKGTPSEKLLGINLMILIASMTRSARDKGIGIDVITDRLLDTGVELGVLAEGFIQTEDQEIDVMNEMPHLTGKLDVLAMIEKYRDPEFANKNFKHNILGGGSEQDMKKPEDEYVREGLDDIKAFVEKNNLSVEEGSALIKKFLHDTSKIYGNPNEIEVFHVQIAKDKLQCSLSHILFMAYKEFNSKMRKADHKDLDVNDATGCELIKLVAFSHRTGTTELVWDLIKTQIPKFDAIVEVLIEYARKKKLTVEDLFTDPNLLDDDEIGKIFEKHLSSAEVDKDFRSQINEIIPGIFNEEGGKKEDGKSNDDNTK